ncbi:hypothetical protein [Pseudoteredinibacter isoporae]|uniref:Uncharacterized protein n=1 Tax=Pseudoteredinibacter isoporae TaxID=570281 RepID=A0A7X0JT80_9GAMM|nr:hypothetical protein [Pseudoteredinibacter isoporae]MBB6521848.1 hypothetical protein [Pseudoteredinibacter isoporae]NHO87393.1 hypothetical protein [Pseudoteredinibacter isoporae]NIB22508.1 hypothetical protein [Pseudoteredinibacter isoporae]
MTNIFSIASELNDGKSFKSGSNIELCPVCGTVLDCSVGAYCHDFEPKIKGFDISYSYEGVLVVSEKFKQVCLELGLGGLSFHSINQKDSLYALSVESVVEFDSITRKTRFVNKCEECGEYESVVGATPVILKEPISESTIEFYRTDLCFGTGRKKHWLIVVNDATKRELEKYNLKGLRFKKGFSECERLLKRHCQLKV